MKNDDRLLFLIHRAQQRLQTHLRNEYRRRGLDVSPPQSLVLFLLREENMQSMSDLSRKLSIDNSAITGLVDRLEKDGFVTREANPEDRRGFLVRITRKGEKELKGAEQIVRKANRNIQTGFSRRETDAFKAVLNGIFSKF